MNMLAIILATTVNFTTQTACHPEDFKHYDTATIRGRFVMENVMEADKINVTYTLYDRFVYGGAMPVTKDLVLEPFDALKAEHFLDRREMGVVNVGGSGVVVADGVEYALDFKDALYLGCGTKDVVFKSLDKANPAKFYLNAALAFKKFVNQRITTDEAKAKAQPEEWTLGNKIFAGKLEIFGTVGLPFVMRGRLHFAEKIIELRAFKVQNSRERQPSRKA